MARGWRGTGPRFPGLWRRTTAVAVAVGILVGVPAVAEASFTGSTQARMAVSTMDMKPTATVRQTCHGASYTLEITPGHIPDRLVFIFKVTVNGAPPYEQSTRDPKQVLTYTDKNPAGKEVVWWTVSNQYTAKGSSNTWSSQETPTVVTCK